ncbi:MAG TPA: hypothetical protein VL172_22615 [Kofleriaceae bacterium]|jgi:hypothetical protein|nr:hypothetical protein [Kofleriaceae bacterium]
MRTVAAVLLLAATACGGSTAPVKNEQPPPRDYQPKMSEAADKAVSDLRAAPGGEMGKIAPMPFGMDEEQPPPPPVKADPERDAACGAFWQDTEPFARAFVPAYAKLADTMRHTTVTSQDVLDYLTVLDDEALAKIEAVKVTYAPLAGPFQKALDNLHAQRDAAATGFAKGEAGDAAAAKAAFERFIQLIADIDQVGEAITTVCPMPSHGGGGTTNEPPPCGGPTIEEPPPCG